MGTLVQVLLPMAAVWLGISCARWRHLGPAQDRRATRVLILVPVILCLVPFGALAVLITLVSLGHQPDLIAFALLPAVALMFCAEFAVAFFGSYFVTRGISRRQDRRPPAARDDSGASPEHP
ncbi:hypothetical protein [Nocardioides sp. GXZ039]|uniref:hypothetical protein n=1 Tax=Nocardioides sp. GXZ039 TaxID=3136018 RepID=UPI0030F43E12